MESRNAMPDGWLKTHSRLALTKTMFTTATTPPVSMSYSGLPLCHSGNHPAMGYRREAEDVTDGEPGKRERLSFTNRTLVVADGKPVPLNANAGLRVF